MCLSEFLVSETSSNPAVNGVLEGRLCKAIRVTGGHGGGDSRLASVALEGRRADPHWPGGSGCHVMCSVR